VPPGPERGQLQSGQAIALADGSVVTPDQVLGPLRPGRKVLITGDTAPTLDYLDLAQGAELLVHEATFCDDERERARETSHSTAREAAQVAAAGGVRMLALTHLSSRYFGPEVLNEARETFPETVVPRDFDVIEIPFPERGGPSLVKGGALQSRPEVVSSEPR
jgi:ribonuclease Z